MEGRIRWKEVHPGSGYRIGLKNRGFNFPEIEFDPPAADMSADSKEELLKKYENSGYPEVDWISGPFAVSPGGQKNLRVVFQTETEPSGRILTPSGNPAQGAHVRLWTYAEASASQAWGPHDFMTTPDDGTFSFVNYPTEKNHLLFLHVSYEDSQGDLHIATRVLLKLRERYREPGTIRLGGNHSIRLDIKPVGDALNEFRSDHTVRDLRVSVSINNHIDEDRTEVKYMAGGGTNTDVEIPGSFRVTGLRPGSVEIETEVEIADKFPNFTFDTEFVEKEIPHTGGTISLPISVKESQE